MLDQNQKLINNVIYIFELILLIVKKQEERGKTKEVWVTDNSCEH